MLTFSAAGITIDLNKIEFFPPNQDALIALANVRTDLADATKSYVSGSFKCILERPWEPVLDEQQEPEPLARRTTIYDHYPLMQQLPERQVQSIAAVNSMCLLQTDCCAHRHACSAIQRTASHPQASASPTPLTRG